MKKSIKAPLLSALVFPGAGHFFLKQKITGTILALFASFGLYSITVTILEKAQKIADQILSGDLPANSASISQLASLEALNIDAGSMDLTMAVLFISWLLGIVDSFRIGLKQDRNIKPTSHLKQTFF